MGDQMEVFIHMGKTPRSGIVSFVNFIPHKKLLKCFPKRLYSIYLLTDHYAKVPVFYMISYDF
jgi:hypothetical protein